MKIMIFAGLSKSILSFNKDLVISMVNMGHEVICIGPEIDSKMDFESIGARFIQLSFNRYSISPITGLKIIKNLSKIIYDEKVDIFYAFQAVPVTYGVFAAHRAGCKHIYAAITGAGKVTQDRKGLYNKTIRFVLTIFMKVSLRYCSKIFFLNIDNQDYFINHRIAKKEQCVKVNGSGVNIQRFINTPVPDHDSFLFVGALLRLKGIMEYMDAARIVKKKYPVTKFVVVGGIDIRLSAITKEELQVYIDDGTIIYEGFQKDVRPFLNDCSVFVLPSYSEGIPTCVLEAMAVGRPILTTDATGCKETVENGVNGFKVPVGDTAKLAEKMIWYIENKETSKKMAVESRRIAEEKYDVHKVNAVMMDAMRIYSI